MAGKCCIEKKGVRLEALILSTYYSHKKDKENMKKHYIMPRVEVASGEATEMLAASLPIGEGTVDGGDALTRENNWDIFSDEEVAEKE